MRILESPEIHQTHQKAPKICNAECEKASHTSFYAPMFGYVTHSIQSETVCSAKLQKIDTQLERYLAVETPKVNY